MGNEELKVENIISEIGSVGTSNLEFYRDAKAISKETETLEEKENLGIIDMRRQWSNWILFFIGLIIFFDIILVTLYGFKVWSFQDTNVVIVIVTENFFKIIGLGVLITSNIFQKIYKH